MCSFTNHTHIHTYAHTYICYADFFIVYILSMIVPLFYFSYLHRLFKFYIRKIIDDLDLLVLFTVQYYSRVFRVGQITRFGFVQPQDILSINI